MAELIDKERAYTALKHEQYTHGLSFSAEAFEKAARIIDQMPTIEAEPVRHGRWIPYTKNRDENVTNVFQCSECEKTVRFIMAHKMCEYTFCPFCNAKMGRC